MNRKLSLLAGLSAALAACQAGPWGPLAVTDEDARIVLEARGGAGPLRIGPRCVTLLVEEVNREITLVWRSGQTSWDPAVRQVVFDDATAGQIRLSDGDGIEVGGAGIAEPGAADQGAPQPKWLSAPDSSCPDELFAVHAVRRIGPQQAPAIERRETRGAHNRTDFPDLDPALQVNFYVDARMDPWSEPVPGVPDELREWTERPVELGADRLLE